MYNFFKHKITNVIFMQGKIILNQAFVGRPICDIQISAKELNLKVRSYDLQSLCSAVSHTILVTLVLYCSFYQTI